MLVVAGATPNTVYRSINCTHNNGDKLVRETWLTIGIDAAGNQTSQALPMSQSSSNIYNSNGQLDHSFDFNGNETKYTYDSQGRTATITYYPFHESCDRR